MNGPTTRGTAAVMDRLAALDPAGPDAMAATNAADHDAMVLEAVLRTAQVIAPDATARHRRVRHAPRRATGRRWLALATAGALVAAVAVGASVLSRPDLVAGPTAATAAQVLTETAGVARSLPAADTLTGEQRIYRALLLWRSVDGVAQQNALDEQWFASDGGYLDRSTPLNADAALALGFAPGARPEPTGPQDVAANEIRWTVDLLKGSGASPTPTVEELDTIPTEPARLRAYLAANAASTIATAATDPSASAAMQTAVVGTAIDLLEQPLAPPTLRGALFELLASLPGVTSYGAVTDALGRRGVQIGFAAPSDAVAYGDDIRFTLDPVTATVLEVDDNGIARNSYIGPTVVSGERALPPGVALTGTAVTAQQPSAAPAR